jgi:60 kDa SS-A/Ro ribonucleoprotein
VSKYADLVAEPVPQTEKLEERQVKNNAGGFVYELDDFARLDRFLILGSDSNTYYQDAKGLTRENAKCVQRCYDADPGRTVSTIVSVSATGRAPKNDPAIFALALGAVHKDVKVRTLALGALPDVCRTGTHLFQFVDTVRKLGRGWGRALKRAVANWYDARPVDSVAYQAIKYRQREGYTHKRLLQTAHPKGDDSPARTALYRWICDKEHATADLPAIVRGHMEAMTGASEKSVVDLVREYRLPWEAIPTESIKDSEVWRTMLPTMGLTAMIRNLGSMTSRGTLTALSDEVKIVVERLRNEGEIAKARIHPFNVLLALATYRSGHGFRGSMTWAPLQPIIDALDDAFYKAFQNVEPTGKRTLVALDVSGSMTSPLMGSPLSVREGAAAMAMVTMRTEPWHHVIGFTSGGRGHFDASGGNRWGSSRGGVSELPISPKMRLDEVVRKTSNLPFGGTDCSLPMLYALERGLKVDSFLVYTDNETWAGAMHPSEALKRYRKETGINAKLVVTGMTSTGFSIADPKDPGMLDVVGFDSAAPAVIADFCR